MKIEKISNNQIKCFLSKGDLLSREIKVSELAYGTEKAQELFKDMMDKAFNEYGFEVENVPLMIEAIPLSTESIMLIITKVDNPEELEDKFAKLPSTNSRNFKKKAIDDNDITAENDKKQSKSSLYAFFIYKFNNLDDIIDVSKRLIDFSIDNSTLYKNPVDNKYYLSIISTKINRSTSKLIRGILSEYSEQVMCNKAILSYYDEHFETIIIDKAIKVLLSI